VNPSQVVNGEDLRLLAARLGISVMTVSGASNRSMITREVPYVSLLLSLGSSPAFQVSSSSSPGIS
jgi:hypothetical protein